MVEKRTIEYDSLIAADPRVFGTSFTNPPVTGGDTVGGALLDWDGSEGTTETKIASALETMFEGEAGSYLLSFTVANRTAGSIAMGISGTNGTARSTNATFTETLTYDPAASSDDDIRFVPASGFDGQVSDYRIRKVGTPFWLDPGWRPETVWEDGIKVGPDTPDLSDSGKITRRFDGRYGWKSTGDTWNTLSIAVVQEL